MLCYEVWFSFLLFLFWFCLFKPATRIIPTGETRETENPRARLIATSMNSSQ